MQDFALISEKTVLFNTMLPLFFDRTPWSKMKAQGLAALERVGIQELAKNESTSFPADKNSGWPLLGPS